MMKITNETGVVYLFARFHHLLGFEKMVRFSAGFPDVMALRDGKCVVIELEFSASGLRTHYKVKGSTLRSHESWMRLVHKGNKWYKVTDWGHEGEWTEDQGIWNELCSDENGNVELVEQTNSAEAPYCSYLKRKSLNYWIDAVVCWKSTEFMKDRLEGEGIEVIELKSRLAELGVSW